MLQNQQMCQSLAFHLILNNEDCFLNQIYYNQLSFLTIIKLTKDLYFHQDIEEELKLLMAFSKGKARLHLLLANPHIFQSVCKEALVCILGIFQLPQGFLSFQVQHSLIHLFSITLTFLLFIIHSYLRHPLRQLIECFLLSSTKIQLNLEVCQPSFDVLL